jgi:DNA-binding beta-propeller fold protein YncE
MAVSTSELWAPHAGGDMRYIADSRWGQDGLPAGAWLGRVSAVLDARDGRIVAFHRGPAIAPVVLFDTAGRSVGAWDAGFGVAHGLRIDAEGHLWLTDVGRHRVVKATVDGEILLDLGIPDVPGADERAFNSPTDVAFGADGSIYVSDGYGNSRVVHLDADGVFIRTWGRRGSAPGEFDTPHSVVVAPDGLVWVSDRHNHRLQVFTPDGEFVHAVTHLGATQGLEFGPDGMLWTTTFRSIEEILSYDSISGQLVRLDPASGDILGSMQTPGHFLHCAATGEIWIGSLSGTIIKLRPGWLVQAADGPREQFDR